MWSSKSQPYYMEGSLFCINWQVQRLMSFCWFILLGFHVFCIVFLSSCFLTFDIANIREIHEAAQNLISPNQCFSDAVDARQVSIFLPVWGLLILLSPKGQHEVSFINFLYKLVLSERVKIFLPVHIFAKFSFRTHCIR